MLQKTYLYILQSQNNSQRKVWTEHLDRGPQEKFIKIHLGLPSTWKKWQ